MHAVMYDIRTTPKAEKPRYSAPKLTLYGDVSQLTAAGSGTPSESTGGGANACSVLAKPHAGCV